MRMPQGNRVRTRRITNGLMWGSCFQYKGWQWRLQEVTSIVISEIPDSTLKSFVFYAAYFFQLASKINYFYKDRNKNNHKSSIFSANLSDRTGKTHVEMFEMSNDQFSSFSKNRALTYCQSRLMDYPYLQDIILDSTVY